MEFVLGFVFTYDGFKVALINKLRPEWQAGFLNGIGGHIEEGEVPYAAMRREFEEETGVEITKWDFKFVMDFGEERVHVFKAVNSLSGIRSATDEKVSVISISTLYDVKVIPNLRWIIPLLLDPHMDFDEGLIMKGVPHWHQEKKS